MGTGGLKSVCVSVHYSSTFFGGFNLASSPGLPLLLSYYNVRGNGRGRPGTSHATDVTNLELIMSVGSRHD